MTNEIQVPQEGHSTSGEQTSSHVQNSVNEIIPGTREALWRGTRSRLGQPGRASALNPMLT